MVRLLKWCCLLLLALPEVIDCLRDVLLQIEPRVVRKGEEATLTCTYDLEKAPLYTVKWYRGRHEFYRYTPTENPTRKVFPFGNVKIDIERSNADQVVIVDVDFTLSGNFSCEVTIDAPSFLTKYAFEQMLVVVLPDGPPSLTTDKASYEIGDVLRATCTARPSRPPTTLTFLLNNIVVCSQCETKKQPSGELWWSELSLVLPLFAKHFAEGRLVLRCTAQITDLYQQHVETVLYDAGGPVPERVTSAQAAQLGVSAVFVGCSILTSMRI